MKKPCIAFCTFELASADKAIRILPLGEFAPRDNRLKKEPFTAWTLTPQRAEQIIIAANAQTDDFLIDYEHQSLNAKQNGQPVPAAAWFKTLEIRDDGIYALNVNWTEAAAAHIDAKEYRYLSPVFSYDPKTGEVLRLINAALTNTPALDGLTDLAAMNLYFSAPDEVEEMDKKTLALLKLPETATAEEAHAAIEALTVKLSESDEKIAALSTAANDDKTAALSEQVAALTNIVTAQQEQIAALSTAQAADNVAALVDKAIADAKALPPQREDLIKWGNADIAALSAFLDKAKPIAALTMMQTPPPNDEQQAPKLTAEELAACKALNISEEEFLKTKGGV